MNLALIIVNGLLVLAHAVTGYLIKSRGVASSSSTPAPAHATIRADASPAAEPDA